MAPKRPLPFVLPAYLDERQRERKLRQLRIKPANIARTYAGDGWILYIPTKKSFFKLPKTMIPSRELEHRIRRIHDYIQEYQRLIDIERHAEMEAQLKEIRSLSGKEREFFGRAILGLKGRNAGRHFDLWLVRFGRDRVIETEIASGDIVLVSRGEPLKSDLTATVMAVGRNYVEVAFNERPPKWIKEEGVRLDLYVNDVTFKRMESNLEALRHMQEPAKKVRDIVLGLSVANRAKPKRFEPFNERLNATQKEAVEVALGSRDLMLIHGPPGTGKTTAVVETIRQFVNGGKKVLAAADSNVAVDNMLQKLAEDRDLTLVRVGHPARIDADLQRHSLMAKIAEDPRSAQVEAMLREAQKLVEARNEHSKPTPARLRGMSKDRIKTLAAEGRSYRGVDMKTIRSMAMWIKEDEKVNRYYDAVRDLERAIVQDILERADVVLSTNGMVGSEAMEGMTFDVAVIDEASQQMEPSTLLPLMRAPKAVLAGDHKQLPPTVVSDLDLLKHSLFERLMEQGDLPQCMLEVQYRMNETIMDFPNRLMYDGRLRADKSVARRTLVLKDSSGWVADLQKILDPRDPVVFLDTVKLDADENLPPRSTSYENPLEAERIVEIAKALVKAGINEADVGIITPYLSQLKRIRKLLEKSDVSIETKSVDGFQGREKEVILISFVRANLAKEIGFVKDRRRLNVAMTRAKTKLIMIGHMPTLSANDPFDALKKWLQERGKMVVLN